MEFPLVTGDNRFDNYPTDDRFPTPLVDTRFDGYPLDARFPVPGDDTRFGLGDNIALPIPPSGIEPEAGFNFGDPSVYDAFIYKGGPGTFIDRQGKVVWNGHNIVRNSVDQSQEVTTTGVTLDGDVGDGFLRTTSVGGSQFPFVKHLSENTGSGEYMVSCEFRRTNEPSFALRAAWKDETDTTRNGAIEYFWDTGELKRWGGMPTEIADVTIEQLGADIVRMSYPIRGPINNVTDVSVYPAWNNTAAGLQVDYRNIQCRRDELPLGNGQPDYVETAGNINGSLRGVHYGFKDPEVSLEFGPELITNGDFEEGTEGWDPGDGWYWEGGQAKCDGTQTSNSGLRQDIGSVAGRRYSVTFTVTEITDGAVRPLVGGTVGGNYTQVGTYTEVITAGSGNTLLNMRAGSSFVGAIDNVFTKELVDYTGTATPVQHGVLIENLPATNIWMNSNDMRDVVGSNIATKAVEIETPVGGTAELCTPANTDGVTEKFHIISYSTLNGLIPVGPLTHSVFIKGVTWRYVQFASSFNGTTAVNVDLQTGEWRAAPGSDGLLNVEVTSMNDGWWRVIHTYTARDTDEYPNINHVTSLDAIYRETAIYQENDGYVIAGGQVEAGDYATSYIPTETTANSRAAEIVTLPTPDLPEKDNLTVQMEGRVSFAATDNRELFRWGNTTADELDMFINPGNSRWRVHQAAGGTVWGNNYPYTGTPLEPDYEVLWNIASAFGAADLRSSFVGEAVLNVATGSFPDITTFPEIDIAQDGYMGSVATLQLWDEALSDRDLVVLAGGTDPGPPPDATLPLDGLIGAYNLNDPSTVTLNGSDGITEIQPGFGLGVGPVLTDGGDILYETTADALVCTDSNSGTNSIQSVAIPFPTQAVSTFMVLEHVTGTVGSAGNCGYVCSNSATGAADSASSGYINARPDLTEGSRTVRDLVAPTVELPDAARYDVQYAVGSAIGEGDVGVGDVRVHYYDDDQGYLTVAGKREQAISQQPNRFVLGRGRRTGHGTRVYAALWYDREVTQTEGQAILQWLKVNVIDA